MPLYETNPNSPFFAFMQNKDVEQSLSNDEKEQRKINAINTLAIWGLENMEFTADEQNYLIYAFINDVNSDFACDKLLNQ
ncbi:TPA: hypothetical protein ACY4AC_002186 [Pasteurella multocida]